MSRFIEVVVGWMEGVGVVRWGGFRGSSCVLPLSVYGVGTCMDCGSAEKSFYDGEVLGLEPVKDVCWNIDKCHNRAELPRTPDYASAV